MTGKTLYQSDWIGEVGIAVPCTNQGDEHKEGRAIDITAIRAVHSFNSSIWWHLDMNVAWRTAAPLKDRRRYLAAACTLRMNFGTVITAWYTDTLHDNHIHAGNLERSLGPIDSSEGTDTSLIQAACNYLDGASIAIDGAWGSQTTAAYDNLLDALCWDGSNPRTTTTGAVSFLEALATAAIKDLSADRWSAFPGSPCYQG